MMRRSAWCAMLAIASAVAVRAGGGQVPTVRSGVELIAVDVEVVGPKGDPVPNLQPADFDVRIDGRPRRVVSADFIRYDTATSAATLAPPASTPVPGEAPPPPPRRLYLLAVDEHSFNQAAVGAAMKAAAGFVDRLQPGDLVGLYAYPTGAAHIDFTTDHTQVKAALAKIQGLLETPRSDFHLALSEVIDINAGDQQVFTRVVARECTAGDQSCPPAVRGEALTIAALLEMRVTQSLGGLRDLVAGLAAIPDRKTAVLVSGGLIANDRIGGRPDAAGLSFDVGREALRANINLYVLHMDTSFMDMMSGRDAPNMQTIFRDGTASAIGLEMVAGASGGAVLRVMAGTGESAFDRVLKETSAHYVLGVAVDEADRDGKAHNIAVRLKRRGNTLRSRTMVWIPKPGAAANAPPEPKDLTAQEPPQVLDKPGAGTPSLETLLRTASEYLDAYEQEASALVSEETYVQKTPEPDPGTSAVSRQLRSDMLILPDVTVGWLGFRDVFEVDGQSVQNRTERLQSLFMRPVPDRMAQARRIVVESSRYNLRSDIFRTINMPMMALRFLRFVDQRRSKFSLDGLQSVDGVRGAVVRFEERETPRMIESSDDAAAKGAFWIEPQTGRVLKSELLFDTGSGAARLRIRVRVSYAPQLADTWGPVSMDEEYRLGKKTLAVEGHATYANFRKFKVETNTRIRRAP